MARKRSEETVAQATMEAPAPAEAPEQAPAEGTVHVTSNGDAIFFPSFAAPERQRRPRSNPDETKSQRFRRLAERRVGKSLAYIRQLIPLANRNQYEYSQEEVDAIREALLGAVERVGLAFAGQQDIAAFRFG